MISIKFQEQFGSGCQAFSSGSRENIQLSGDGAENSEFKSNSKFIFTIFPTDWAAVTVSNFKVLYICVYVVTRYRKVAKNLC